jgi:AcrR family transcriptional regulator
MRKVPSPAGRPRSKASREAILAAAREIFARVGYARFTFDAVAAEAKAGKATIYRWWPTKGALLLEAARDDISIGVVPDTGDTREDLRRAIEQLVTTFSRPLAQAVIFAAISPHQSDPELAQTFREIYVYPWRVTAAEALRRGAARGDIASDADVAFLLDLVVGTVLQRAMVLKTPDTVALADKLLAVLLDAV